MIYSGARPKRFVRGAHFVGRWHGNKSGEQVVAEKQTNALPLVAARHSISPANQDNRGFYTGNGTFFALHERDVAYPRETSTADTAVRVAHESGVSPFVDTQVRYVPRHSSALQDRRTMSARLAAFLKGKRMGPSINNPQAFFQQKDQAFIRNTASRTVFVPANRTLNGK